MNKAEVIKQLLPGPPCEPGPSGRAFAPANIALCKYWGKRDDELNLPVTSSLSMSLGTLGATTEISRCEGPDRIFLNGQVVAPEESFAQRVSAYLDLFRDQHGYDVRTVSTVPVAAGLASSASGFAALALALDDLYGWALDQPSLSILARLGSGSACRSLGQGFFEWHAGTRDDGMDSFAEPLRVEWPDLRIGLLELSGAPKPVGSRAAMRRTRDTGALYRAWPEKVAQDLPEIRTALEARDLDRLGAAAESNALAMHATMLSARPPVLYWLPESVAVMRSVWEARAAGESLYFTMDAGPNIKVLFLEANRATITERFPSVRIVEQPIRSTS